MPRWTGSGVRTSVARDPRVEDGTCRRAITAAREKLHETAVDALGALNTVAVRTHASPADAEGVYVDVVLGWPREAAHRHATRPIVRAELRLIGWRSASCSPSGTAARAPSCAAGGRTGTARPRGSARVGASGAGGLGASGGSDDAGREISVRPPDAATTRRDERPPRSEAVSGACFVSGRSVPCFAARPS